MSKAKVRKTGEGKIWCKKLHLTNLDFEDFGRNPKPQTVEEWKKLYNKQIEFLEKRNRRIDNAFNKYVY